MLGEYHDGFDAEKRKILRIGFRDGFKIDFEGEDCELDCVNSKAAQELPQAIGKKIKLELSKGRLAGPFSEKNHLSVSSVPLYPFVRNRRRPIIDYYII